MDNATLTLLLLTLPAAPAAQTANQSRLDLRKPIQRELTLGQSHSYVMTLESGQYINIAIAQPFAVLRKHRRNSQSNR